VPVERGARDVAGAGELEVAELTVTLILIAFVVLWWLGWRWWMSALDGDPTDAEIEQAWAAYYEAKRLNTPITTDLSRTAGERLAAQQLIDRAHSRAVDMEFAHCN
jgi:hypothetical protein